MVVSLNELCIAGNSDDGKENNGMSPTKINKYGATGDHILLHSRENLKANLWGKIGDTKSISVKYPSNCATSLAFTVCAFSVGQIVTLPRFPAKCKRGDKKKRGDTYQVDMIPPQ